MPMPHDRVVLRAREHEDINMHGPGKHNRYRLGCTARGTSLKVVCPPKIPGQIAVMTTKKRKLLSAKRVSIFLVLF